MPDITTVPAGATIVAQWDAGAHPGPNIVYMAKVSNATTPTITGLSWTKVIFTALLALHFSHSLNFTRV